MHELSVTESILEIALRHAEQNGGGRVTDLFLVIGELSSIVDDSVRFYWDIVAEGSAAQGAELHFRRIPAELACRACGRRYAVQENLTCPACGGSDIRVAAGREFYLEAINVTALEAARR